MPMSSLITSSGKQRREVVRPRRTRRRRASVSSSSPARRRMNGSSSAMRFGVNTRATTLRCHVCSGGSLTIRNGASFSKPSMVTPPALLHGGRVGVRGLHVGVARQRPEVVLLVVVHRRLVAETPVDRVRVVRGEPRVRVELDVDRRVVDGSARHWRHQSASMIIAAPMPPPAHIDTQPRVLPAAVQLVDHRDDHARTGARDRVTEAGAAAVDVHDLLRDPELARRGDRHRAERLVDLPEVDVGDRQAGAVERLRDGERGREPGARRLEPDRRPRDDAGHRREAVRRGVLARRDHDRGRGVVEPGGVARGDRGVARAPGAARAARRACRAWCRDAGARRPRRSGARRRHRRRAPARSRVRSGPRRSLAARSRC